MKLPNYRNNQLLIYFLLIISIISIGIVRIVLTYDVYWQTWDEPFHVAAGVEWLDKGQYTYEQFHPPLARVLSALGPYLSGARCLNNTKTWGDVWVEGNAILHAGGEYEHNIMLARVGILPFFIIASLVVSLWAKKYGGIAPALLATLLFTTLPPILAHAGLATLDMACAALVTAALFALISWLNNPALLQSFFLGITTGLAILAKLSVLGYLPAAGGLIGIVFCFCSFRKIPIETTDFTGYKRRISASFIALIICSLSIWAGYRFSHSHLFEPNERPHKALDRIVGTAGGFHDTTYMILQKTPVLAPEFFRGISKFQHRNNSGHKEYFFGEIREMGWWYYYPLVLIAKTPLPFTLFSVIGIFFIFSNVRHFNWEEIQLMAPVIAVMGILIISMLGHVNNGLRQILCVYPLLSVIAGYGAFKLISLQNRSKIIGVIFVLILMSWQLVSSYVAHPDYLAYYNELASNYAVEFGVDSDLDWGQDLKRLATTLKKREVSKVNIRYNGSEGLKLELFDFPQFQQLTPYQKESGWVAISIRTLVLGTGEVPYDQFSWLKDYQPVEKVGQSILLYYIP